LTDIRFPVILQPRAGGQATDRKTILPYSTLLWRLHKILGRTESHATQGNGVGLAIVKKVVELHQGQVHVGCDENSTTFTVVLLCFIDG